MIDPYSRVAAVMAAVPEIDPADPLLIGGVAFTSIRAESADGEQWVEATVSDPACGDPTFRVFNPPALVADPDGDVERGGVRYRSDPLAALAEVVAANGGRSARPARAL